MFKPPAPAQCEIKPYITMSYALFIVVLLGLGLFGWYKLQAHVQQVYSTVEEANEKIRLARTMQTAILKRIVVLHNAYDTNDPFLRDELRLRFIDLAGEYRLARTRLLELGQSPEEQLLDQKITRTIIESQALTEAAMEHAIDGVGPDIFLPAVARAETTQNKLISQLDQLVELERERQQMKLDYSNEEFELFRKVVFISSILVFLVTTLIAINLGRVILRRSHLALDLAHKDALTNLPNRLAFTQALNLAIEEARRDTQTHCLLYLDLDKFKPINDNCGHAAGDRLLQEITHKWRLRIREDDFLARVGGDEFTLLLMRTAPEQASKIANELVTITERFSFEHRGKTFRLGVSIGITVIDKDTKDAQTILDHADQACYSAKIHKTQSIAVMPLVQAQAHSGS